MVEFLPPYLPSKPRAVVTWSLLDGANPLFPKGKLARLFKKSSAFILILDCLDSLRVRYDPSGWCFFSGNTPLRP